MTTHVTAAPLTTLVSPLGLVSRVQPLQKLRGLDRLEIYSTEGGSGRPGESAPDAEGSGSGRVLGDADLSRTIAIAEGAERYAGTNLHHEPVWAKATELDGPVLDTSRLPRCSERELADSRCRVRPFSDEARIRWVRGVDLIGGNEVWVPAALACYGLRGTPDERFGPGISTGFSIHTDMTRSVLGGVHEILERDSIALTWLQRLPLPPLADEVVTDDARQLIDWSRRRFIDTYLYDATSDIGVPTVFVLQSAPHDDQVRMIIGAGNGRSYGEAVDRAMLETLTTRGLFYGDDQPRDDYAEFHSVVDGARFMSRPERAGAFAFLLDGLAERTPSAWAPELPEDPERQLAAILSRLADAGMQAVAVDLTSSEMRGVGLSAVAVVIPDLQPMSLNPLANFRAHPRLSTALARMGHACPTEEEQNPWPVPFA
ncbi:YcaO-like family protein [Streptomyces sp. NPDC020965]|uniref:YcaO-like family protein n=1 Tax=Streptomyces sp. NPDC020965 TaxID=3365105 RepID=UPI0037AF5B83